MRHIILSSPDRTAGKGRTEHLTHRKGKRMRIIRNRFVAPLFALLLAASLTFGVTAVFAQVGGPCDYSPPTVLGACSSEQQCDDRCAAHGGWEGDCVVGPNNSTCCLCAI